MAFECSATGEGPVFYTHMLRPKSREFLEQAKEHARISDGEICFLTDRLCFQGKWRKDHYKTNNAEQVFEDIELEIVTPIQKKAIDTLYARSRELWQGSANISRSQILEILNNGG